MQIRAELCHVDTLRCIVRVEAWHDGSLQGSALGEAATAEEAEERAGQTAGFIALDGLRFCD